jgi:drug/metabolite transporter (DMT)-like permease
VSEVGLPLPQPEAPEPRAAEGLRWRADLALVVAAFAFGITFVIVQEAVEDAKPVPFLAVRFLLGAAVLGVLAHRRPASAGEVRHGLAAGAALAVGYVLQTVGLQHTTPSTSAFLTYLLVVFVPLLAWVALGRRPSGSTVGGVVLAVAGLALLSGGTGGGIGRGELLTLGCAVAFAVHLLIVGETAGRHDPLRLTTIQLVTVGIACLAPSLVTGGLALPGTALAAAVFTGVVATALAFAAMVSAQQIVSPSRAALILLLEPVFTALLAWAMGDPPGAATVAGGALILAAVALAEVVPLLVGARESVPVPPDGSVRH